MVIDAKSIPVNDSSTETKEDKPNKPTRKLKAYGNLSWRLRFPDGTVLARAASAQALLNTARVMFDIREVNEGAEKFYYILDIDEKVCATISTKTTQRKENKRKENKLKSNVK